MLFCLTCFVRAEEVQFEEAPKSPRAIPSVTGTQLLRTNKTRKAKKNKSILRKACIIEEPTRKNESVGALRAPITSKLDVVRLD